MTSRQNLLKIMAHCQFSGGERLERIALATKAPSKAFVANDWNRFGN